MLRQFHKNSSQSSKSHPRRALLQQLQDDSDDDVPQQPTTHLPKTAKGTILEDTNESPQEVEETAAPKRKK